MNKEIYLDANATSPTLPVALAAAVDAMQSRFGNPSSSHAAGLQAAALREAARASARRVLQAGAGDIVFTSGATEAIQTAVLSALLALRQRQLAAPAADASAGSLLVYGATEHKAVPECLAHWNAILGTGLTLQALAVDADGRHRLDQLAALGPRVGLLCTMAANNETGVVSDLAGIEAVLAAHAPQALWLVDCVQALGKLPLNLAASRIDYAPFSGHKLYAPKGIGMLYVRANAPYTALMVGGGQEGARRSGTENMAGIAAFGAVLQALEDGVLRGPAQLAALRQQLAEALQAAFPGLQFNMPFERSLPTTLNFSVAGVGSADLLALFDAAGVRVSAGSACSAAAASASHVLVAMGIDGARAAGAVRLSFSPTASDAFIATACQRIARCGAALAAHAPAPVAAMPAAGAVAAVTAATDQAGHAVDGAAVDGFLARHPAARLIDVREAFEHAAAASGHWHGRAVTSIPLSVLPAQLATLAAAPDQPLLLLCRSGKRSAEARRLLQAAGHRCAYHLAGGLALAGA